MQVVLETHEHLADIRDAAEFRHRIADAVVFQFDELRQLGSFQLGDAALDSLSPPARPAGPGGYRVVPTGRSARLPHGRYEGARLPTVSTFLPNSSPIWRWLSQTVSPYGPA